MPDAYDDPEAMWQAFARGVITLHLADGGAARAGVDRMPWPGVIHVITAWNPGFTATAAENEAANIRLLAELDDRGIVHCPATGADPDGSWSEDGFAVTGLTRAEAIELGQRHGQLAIYEIDGTDVVIVDCRPT